MTAFAEFHRRSLERARRLLGRAGRGSSTGSGRFDTICDDSQPPFARWFVGGTTNLCHNAVDRHLAARADQPALIYVSTETDSERIYSFARTACRGAAHGRGAASSWA